MSGRELENIIESIHAMQASWSEDMGVDAMRADLETLYRQYPSGIDSTVEPVDAGGVKADLITVPGSAPNRIILHFHGGGFAVGSARSHQYLAEWLASAAQASVLLVDYRLAPEHVYPAQLDDAQSSYRWLLAQGYSPDSICVAGDSAGGGLALALLAVLSDTGEPLPACVATISAWTDMRASGGSYDANAAVDPVGTKEMAVGMGLQYAGEESNLDHPHVSPVNMEFSGMPPLLMQAGTRDIFYDDSRIVVDRAIAVGVDATLAQWPGMIHQWHLYSSALAEGREASKQLGEFIKSHTKA